MSRLPFHRETDPMVWSCAEGEMGQNGSEAGFKGDTGGTLTQKYRRQPGFCRDR